MPRLLFVPMLAVLVFLATALTTGASPNPEAPPVDTSGVPDPTEGVQSNEESLAQDLGLVAEAKGWTVEEAAADHRAAEAVGRIAEQVAAERPDIFVGSVLSPEPGEAPSLYVKGPADDFVRSLVASAEIPIKLVDNQPYSFDELEERKIQVHRALEDQGFRHVSTGFSVAGGGEVTAGVSRHTGLPTEAAEILSGLPASLRDSVVLTVSDVPIALDESAFGGMQLRDDGANECTSGWSVWDASGTTGATGAGHCSGINQIVDPNVGVVNLAFQAEHRGQWGDVEWYTSAQLEPAKFYADSNNVRYVKAVEPRASISAGESVCLYGRASNVRDCSLDVQNVSQACTNAGVFNDRLVLMDGDVGINGDSGGGWSFNFTAFGSHKGNCNPDFPQQDTFSVADLYDEALGVRVRIADTLPTSGVLRTGDFLLSDDGRFTAIMQTDGNFVLYRNGVGALWASGSCGQSGFGSNIQAVMQSDGNFVLYDAGALPAKWATSWAQTQPSCPSNQQTVFGSGVFMVMQTDGNLVMYKPGYGAVWASNTCCY